MADITRPNLDEKVITDLVTEHRRAQWEQTVAETKAQLAFLTSVREKVKDVKGFWVFTLYQHQGFHAAAASKGDTEALSFLTDVELKKDPQDPREVEIIFSFSKNPYFTNETLSKKFVLNDETASSKEKVKAGEFPDELLNFSAEDDLVAKPTEINWKSEDRNLCKLQPSPDFSGDDFDGDLGSFFNWFTASADPLDLRNIIAEEILPDCMDYYMGQGEYSVSDDEDDEDDEESDGDENEEIDLLDEEQPKKKKAKKN